MRFRPARPGSRAAPARLSCYGKLPCHAEFLRLGIDSEAGRWVVEGLDAAHDAIVAAGQRISADRELRMIIRLPDGPASLLAMLVRGGTDSRGRGYPVAVFTALDPAGPEASAHLAPLRCAPMWPSVGRRVIENPGRTRETLEGLLDTAVDAPDGIEAAAERFALATSAPLKQPWLALANAGETRADALAAAVAAHGAGAPSPRSMRLPDAVASALPLTDAAMLASIWLRLLAAGGGARPWAAVVEVWKRTDPRWQQLFVLDRPPSGADLAYLLGDVGESPGPVLGDAGAEPGPLSAAAEAVLANLRARDAACLADLWRGRGPT